MLIHKVALSLIVSLKLTFPPPHTYTQIPAHTHTKIHTHPGTQTYIHSIRTFTQTHTHLPVDEIALLVCHQLCVPSKSSINYKPRMSAWQWRLLVEINTHNLMEK